MTNTSWSEKLQRLFARNRGARLGEATVVSRLVHARDQSRPHGLMLLMGADAGQTFYGRKQPGEVVHLDVFHEAGEVDHRQVAGALMGELGQEIGPDGRPLLDLFDLQTGTGGGRVTGDLTGGQKESLRRNHLNHVHLAGRLANEQLHLLGPLVRAVEEVILGAGLELRKIERIAHLRSGMAEGADLSPYSESGDSLLKEAGAPGREPTESLDRRPQGPASNGPGETPGRGQASASSGTGGQPTEAAIDQALAIVKKVGSPEELVRLLREGDRPEGWNLRQHPSGVHALNQLRELEEGGYLTRTLRGPVLTEEGRHLLQLLESHLRAIKQRFRKLVRRAPGTARLHRPGQAADERSINARSGPIRGAVPAQPGDWLGEIAVLETVRGAVTRAHLGALAQPGPVRLTLRREDVWIQQRASERPLHICILIDASASMAGRRIQAAKHLVRHLLSSTKDKLAVIAFQEREVKVHVPFTRDWAAVEAGLANVQPMGLTPLAHGLSESLALIAKARARRPLLLLITDGIPTVAKWGLDPLADGLKAARSLAEAGVPFGCIGLQPSRRYLADLCATANGTLHVVDELDANALVAIAHQERRKLARRLRQGMGARRAKSS
ncbi:MAG TPA: VWA domain-containing protein [Symbiobacteriaceae bacterium]|nr:VWA domain-containing protein [Symbiobacteriaceae bacterium]